MTEDRKTVNDRDDADPAWVRREAGRLLAGLQTALDAVTLALARRCSADGRLQAAALDAQQVAAFELSWAAAELLAAQTAIGTPATGAPAIGTQVIGTQVIGTPAGGIDPLDARLALLFAADAMGAVLDRLDVVAAEAGHPADALDRLRADPAWRRVRHAAAGAAALQAAGRGVIEAGGLVGEIALDEAHAMARDAFRRFGQDVVAPEAEAIHRQNLTVPESLLQPMREMGVFGLAIPERYGGSAPDGHDDTLLMVVVTEALSEASLAAAGSLITRPEILTRALMAGGTEAQKQHWLPRLASGEVLSAIAMTEPDYGSDLAACMLKGTRVEGGWRLDGAKTWCTFAGKAGVLMVVTRTDPDRSAGHRGLSLLLAEKPSFDTHDFVVEQPGGGRLTGRAIPTIGYRGMHSFDLQFEGYFVPDANVIGAEAGLGKGFYYTLAGMIGGRMQTSARACGVMRAALRAAVRYVQDRKVFGAPLADFALTRAKLARMGARLLACRRLACETAAIVDRGDGRMEASLVKLLACRSAEYVAREAVQLHGGNGYAEESPVSRYYVDARVLSIFEGAEETLALRVIARSLMERALAGAQRAAAVVPGEGHR